MCCVCACVYARARVRACYINFAYKLKTAALFPTFREEILTEKSYFHVFHPTLQ